VIADDIVVSKLEWERPMHMGSYQNLRRITVALFLSAAVGLMAAQTASQPSPQPSQILEIGEAK